VVRPAKGASPLAEKQVPACEGAPPVGGM
jgi:hypothetical protein